MLALRRSPCRLWAAARNGAVSGSRPLSNSARRTQEQEAAPSTPTTPPPTPASSSNAASISSCPAGTVLKHINYIAGRPDPVALPDDQYPAWLWETIKTKKSGSGGEDDAIGDLYSKSRKARALAAKAARRKAKLAPTEAAVPIDEQTLDVPYATSGKEGEIKRIVSAAGLDGKVGTVEIGGEGRQVSAEEADEARMEIRRVRRERNRGAIKEKNFLTSM